MSEVTPVANKAQSVPVPSATKEEILKALKGLAGDLKSQFTDSRDELRVGQALASLATASMAIELLYSTVQGRVDLKAMHAEEAKSSGHYALERSAHSQHYAAADLYAHDGS